MGARAWRAIATDGRAGGLIAAATLLALGLRIYQLSRPGYLFGVTEYDDGTFFGNSVRLVYGAIPYRDFVSVEPPGSTLLMLPAALVAKAVGTAWGLVITRVLTTCADVVAVPLVGLLVRHRGPLATLLACGILAVYPDGIFAAHTLMLEPWLNLCCLLGALAMFNGDRWASDRSVLLGGVFFGFAATIKLWAFVPAMIAGALCLPRPRRAAAFACGLAAAIAATVLPFAIAAPGGFLRDVIVSQFMRATTGPRMVLPRLANLSGLSGVSGTISAGRLYLPVGTVVGGSVAICVFVLVTYACAALVRRRPPAPLDLYALLGAAAVIAMFMWPTEFYAHYAAFFGPFLALVVSLPVGWLTGHKWLAEGGGTWLPRLGAAAAVAVIGIMAVTQAGAEEDTVPAADPAAIADRIIPPGACVVSDTVSLTVVSNRFVSDAAGCPLVVDSFGTLMADTGGRNMNAGNRILRGIAGTWRTWFMRARFVWLDGATFGRIPWNSALDEILHQPVQAHPALYGGSGPGAAGGLYVRIGGAALSGPGPRGAGTGRAAGAPRVRAKASATPAPSRREPWPRAADG